jgi:hypothetical protein
VKSRSFSIPLVLGLLLFAGCGGSTASSAPGALAVIVGAHANMVAPSVLDTIQTEIDTAAGLGSPATVIVDDGSPTASAPLSLKAVNDNPLYRQDQVNQLKNLIDKTRADNPEVDLLAAISLAARSVSDAIGPKTIVVIDSGLQTTGALRFQDQDGALLNANPDEVVELLRRTQQLPKLTGMRVVFTGLGGTTAAAARADPRRAGGTLDKDCRIRGRKARGQAGAPAQHPDDGRIAASDHCAGSGTINRPPCRRSRCCGTAPSVSCRPGCVPRFRPGPRGLG